MNVNSNCLEREQIFSHASKMLDARKENEVRAHLESCAACRAIAAEFDKLDAVLDAWRPAEPSPGFDARVRAAVTASDSAKPRLFGIHWSQFVAPACLVVLVVVATLVVFERRRPAASRTTAYPTAGQAAPPPKQGSALPAQASAPADENELSLYQNLPVLEDYDMLANFDVLSELPKGEKKIAN